LKLAHSEICFSRRYSKSPIRELTGQGIRLASCIVVECDSGAILLTKRAKTMRVFPNSWILPGGHIEAGESLESGVVRELFEETGIDIKISKEGDLTYKDRKVTMTPFFAFESSLLTKKHVISETVTYWRDVTDWTQVKILRPPDGHLIVYFRVKL
jgi:8-oxo-dGTP pyrophosphatase MutT (NUDIX family)